MTDPHSDPTDDSNQVYALLDAFLSLREEDPGADFESWLDGQPETLHARVRRAYDGWLEADDALGAGSRELLGHRLTAGVRVGEFVLVQHLGRGGQGTVWEATQPSVGGRHVALKLLRPDHLSDSSVSRFAREARAGGRLSHPGIVTVYGSGTIDGIGWIAMELVQGSRTLRDRLLEDQSRTEQRRGHDREVARLVAEVAEAMQAAHNAGVIHRDLKPQNILLDRQDRPRVSDFGLARLTDESDISKTGELAGTYAYMSPEQVAARRAGIDHRTDVFSLGVVLYELLTLQRPFQGDTGHQVAAQILSKKPPDPRTIRSRVPRDLVVIVGRALEKEPGRRYASMDELAADLRRFLANEPILAQPPTALGRLARWARRNPAKGVAAGIGVSAALVISVLLVDNLAKSALAEERFRDLSRLSALQNYESLVARSALLWPAHPDLIDAYEEWVQEMRALVDELGEHRRTQGTLAVRATRETLEEFLVAHPDDEDCLRRAYLEGKRHGIENSLAWRRDGLEVELPELDWARQPAEAGELTALAWNLAGRDRAVFGREAEGYLLARRALSRIDAGDVEAEAQAQLALASGAAHIGRLEEARAAGQRAVELARDDRRRPFQAYTQDMEGAIRTGGNASRVAGLEAQLVEIEEELATLEGALKRRRAWRLPVTEADQSTQWWLNTLTQFIASLDSVTDPAAGLLSEAPNAVSERDGWSIPRRLALAERLRDGLAEGGEWEATWQEVQEAIRDHPLYDELDLPPQVGLVPIGPDPVSELWEFWHVATGTMPIRDEEGTLQFTEESGVVLVLIPGGSPWIGAQRQPGENSERAAAPDEGPVHRVELSPYFLSKFEMTQGQWKQITGRNPSTYGPDGTWEAEWIADHPNRTYLSPVETVSWIDARKELARMGLSLPSEAQWEHACRAGTRSPWWTGDEPRTLEGAANLPDSHAMEFGGPPPPVWAYIDDFYDGATTHAPVGGYLANPFGLHDVHGNVEEWCEDGFDPQAYSRHLLPVGADPVEPWFGKARRVARGGKFSWSPMYARSAFRDIHAPWEAEFGIGIRPARAIDPAGARPGEGTQEDE